MLHTIAFIQKMTTRSSRFSWWAQVSMYSPTTPPPFNTRQRVIISKSCINAIFFTLSCCYGYCEISHTHSIISAYQTPLWWAKVEGGPPPHTLQAGVTCMGENKRVSNFLWDFPMSTIGAKPSHSYLTLLDISPVEYFKHTHSLSSQRIDQV